MPARRRAFVTSVATAGRPVVLAVDPAGVAAERAAGRPAVCGRPGGAMGAQVAPASSFPAAVASITGGTSAGAFVALSRGEFFLRWGER